MRLLRGNIFTEQFQTKMTWTGKTNIKGVKKIPLQSYKQIMDLICKLAKAADKSIDAKLSKDLVVYHVLKYAYRNSTADEADIAVRTTKTTAAEPILVNEREIATDKQTNGNHPTVTPSGSSGQIYPQYQYPPPQFQYYPYQPSNLATVHGPPPMQHLLLEHPAYNQSSQKVEKIVWKSQKP